MLTLAMSHARIEMLVGGENAFLSRLFELPRSHPLLI